MTANSLPSLLLTPMSRPNSSARKWLPRALEVPWVGKSARGASDWIDLQWSLTVQSLRGVAPRARGRLLDVGCGSKPYEPIFRPYVAEYVGVEHESTFEVTAAEHSTNRPDVLYDGDRLPFADDTFDTVLSVQVLEHTPHPAALVVEMGRVLKPDGILILTAPFSFRLHEEPHDYFRYSPHGLRQLCTDAGLTVIEMQQQGSLWSLIGHKLNSYLGLEIARIGGVAQSMGKLSHEAVQARPPRWWTLPWVVPTMGAISLGARLLDSALPDRTEALGFLVIAEKPQRRG